MAYMAPRDFAAWRPAHGMSVRGYGAMGDDAAGNPVSALAAQVNRFGPGAPSAYRFVSAPFPLSTVVVDPGLAVAAIAIYQRRATDSYNQFHDAGSAAAIAAANQGFTDPVAFVSGHLADVTQAIAGFADSVGIPPAGQDASGTLSGTTGVLLAAAAGLALWWMVK